jgi:hypothetical protein
MTGYSGIKALVLYHLYFAFGFGFPVSGTEGVGKCSRADPLTPGEGEPSRILALSLNGKSGLSLKKFYRRCASNKNKILFNKIIT